MNYLTYILILAFIIGGCSASEPQYEYSFTVCEQSTFKLTYDASVKLLEFYPTDCDSTIIPPEFTIDRDSLASMVFYPPIAHFALSATVLQDKSKNKDGYSNPDKYVL